MISSENQNQFPSSFAPLGDLLKALIFLLNLNGFNSSTSSPDQRFAQQKGFSKVWKEKGSKWFSYSLSLSLSLSVYTLLVCFVFLFWVNLVLCYILFNMFLFVCFQFCFILFFIIFFLKNQKNTKTVCVLCTLVLVYLGWLLKQSFLIFVFFVT